MRPSLARVRSGTQKNLSGTQTLYTVEAYCTLCDWELSAVTGSSLAQMDCLERFDAQAIEHSAWHYDNGHQPGATG